MIRELKTYQAEGRYTLREMLIRLQNEALQRIEDLRRDQEQESDSGPADEMDSASTTGEIETHAGLIARAEEKLRYLDEAMLRLVAGTLRPMSKVRRRNSDRASDGDSLRFVLRRLPARAP